jgi:iron-sulfur cluster repair protein YtfE (RIC family)
MATARKPIDFTLMYSTHDALRRDISKLGQAVDAGRADAPRVLAGWQAFQQQLSIHHLAEDTALWPRVATAVAGRPDALKLLEEMEAEHAKLDPLLESVEQLIRNGSPTLGAEVDRLESVLDFHLKHEETAALPLIQQVLSQADWRRFAADIRKRQGFSGAAFYVPWAIDGVSHDERRRFFGAMPPPVAVLNKLWEPRYKRLHLWATD